MRPVPLPLPSRSARRFMVSGPVSSTSGSCWLPPSLLLTAVMLHTTAPEPASEALTDTVTARILLFGGHRIDGSAVADAIDGPVVSRLMVTLSLDVPPSDVAVQVKVVPVVSLETVCVSQPDEVNADSGSATSNETVTFDVYQPPLLVPETVGVMTGGVVSEGPPSLPAAIV